LPQGGLEHLLHSIINPKQYIAIALLGNKKDRLSGLFYSTKQEIASHNYGNA
jgi:hypothetical protein